MRGCPTYPRREWEGTGPPSFLSPTPGALLCPEVKSHPMARNLHLSFHICKMEMLMLS